MSKVYKNPHIHNIRRRLFDVAHLFLGNYTDDPIPEHPPKDFIYPKPDYIFNENEPLAQWINHCTFLLQIEGIHILTDPIWSERCSPFKYIGPKRTHPPALDLKELPKIDIVLISHNHYDHLDKKTVKLLHRYQPDILWIVPKGLKTWFKRRGVHNVKELSWWEEFVIDHGIDKVHLTITGVPSQHNSGRTLFDTNRSLWLGYVVRFTSSSKGKSKHCYFVGDTAYNPYDFKKIGKVFPSIDLCLCPIGTYAPGPFMRTVHSSPEDAVAIHQDVNAKFSLAMHWRTFQLAFEPLSRPPYDLYLAMKQKGLNPEKFIPLNPGERVNW